MTTATQPALTIQTVNHGITDHKVEIPANMLPALDYLKSVEAYFSESPAAYTNFLNILQAQAYHNEENKTGDYEVSIIVFFIVCVILYFRPM